MDPNQQDTNLPMPAGDSGMGDQTPPPVIPEPQAPSSEPTPAPESTPPVGGMEVPPPPPVIGGMDEASQGDSDPNSQQA